MQFKSTSIYDVANLTDLNKQTNYKNFKYSTWLQFGSSILLFKQNFICYL